MTTCRPARFVARAADSADGQAAPAGICPEALAVLAGYRLPERTTSALRRMKGPRQLAAARVMAGADNCSGDLARALLAATPASQRADDPRGRQSDRHGVKLLSGLEKGLTHMQETVQFLTPGYHDDLYCLALAASFVRGWMQDDVVTAWLLAHAPGAAAALGDLVSVSEKASAPRRTMKLPYARAVQATPTRRN
ncbi:plasmid partitioning protein RepB C-terminal domain-containing protein [Paraburkholderia agricolaris]|uniref:plasmid partitioning protein RepB C-terminal domain-containing protein n=1 Tax=Paraburkholderia agricolaris TaxID=2152888 RepID=UPI00129281DC|nr:plasmid partitioning protein RepB C-terminal domain-containing protein [Paraburkholderia agricolaris]